MKKRIITVLLSAFLVIGFSSRLHAIEIYNFRDLELRLNKNDDTTYVIHFWATWCVPCLKEMPAFNELADNHARQKVKIVLVSLDFPEHVNDKLIPFIKKHNIKSEVIVLDDPDQNYWINRVNPGWSGAIPATLIYNSAFRKFYERSLTYEELVKFINLKN